MWRFRKVNPRWDERTLAFEDVRLWPFLANVASIRDSPSDPLTADVAEPNDCNVITRRRFVRRRRVAGPLFNHYLLSYPDDLHGESQVAAAGGWRREDVVYVPASFENSRACSTLPAVDAMMKAIADGRYREPARDRDRLLNTTRRSRPVLALVLTGARPPSG